MKAPDLPTPCVWCNAPAEVYPFDEPLCGRCYKQMQDSEN